MYTNKANPSSFCQHYTRHNRLAPTTSYSDTTSTDSNGFSSPSEERRRKMTFAWAAEQEFLRSDKRGMTTEEWVQQQQREFQPKGVRIAPRAEQQSTSRRAKCKGTFMSHATGETVRVRLREVGSQGRVYVIATTASTYEESEWERVQNEARSRIREEFKKMEDHLRSKQEVEREEQRKRERMARAALEEKENRDRMRIEGIVRDSWKRYEDGWSSMTGSTTEQLFFESIPWPVMIQPKDGESGLTKKAIAGFLFSPLHSPNIIRKERLRNALLRWHPDRFSRFTNRIEEEEREKVMEAVGIVARILNDLII